MAFLPAVVPGAAFGGPIPSELLPADHLDTWRLHARQTIYEEETLAAQRRYLKGKQQLEDNGPSEDAARKRAAEIMRNGRQQIQGHHAELYKQRARESIELRAARQKQLADLKATTAQPYKAIESTRPDIERHNRKAMTRPVLSPTKIVMNKVTEDDSDEEEDTWRHDTGSRLLARDRATDADATGNYFERLNRHGPLAHPPNVPTTHINRPESPVHTRPPMHAVSPSERAIRAERSSRQSPIRGGLLPPTPPPLCGPPGTNLQLLENELAHLQNTSVTRRSAESINQAAVAEPAAPIQ